MRERRRTEEVSGCVNFPIDNPLYKSSNEGGMFVRLVVVDPVDLVKPIDYDNKWVVCCGGYQYLIMDECYQRDDLREIPYDPDFEINYKKRQEYEEFHFPDLNNREKDKDDEKDIYRRYRSIPYLAIMTIGSTGWSGWSDELGGYWYCTFDDLTEEGKELYRNIEKLYPGCKIYLQTWLDT